MQRALDVAGIVCRYALAILACVWFIQFLVLIGQSADRSQELAGMAIGRAVICGGAAAIWFYRARKTRQVQKFVEHTLKTRQSAAPVQQNVTSLPVPNHLTQLAMPPATARSPQDINKMICGACGKESASDFNFCPHCGKAFVPRPTVIESLSPSPEVQSVANTPTDESELIKDGVAGTSVRVGTLVFGAFSAISLLVSIIKGIVPIYLLEAAGWAGAAWYWQGKKTHSDVAKAIVIVLAVLVAIGEVVHFASQPDSKSTAPIGVIHSQRMEVMRLPLLKRRFLRILQISRNKRSHSSIRSNTRKRDRFSIKRAMVRTKTDSNMLGSMGR